MNDLAVRFEVFDPGDVAEFGMLSKNAMLKQACDAAYQQGYRDAEGAAAQASQSKTCEILGRIAEAADDFCLTNTEARSAVLQSLQPLVEKLIGSVLPACASDGLAREVAEVVANLADSAPAETLCIHVGSAQTDAVRSALEQAGIAARVRTDAQLGDLQTRISIGDGWEQLDLGNAEQAVQRVVEDFFEAAKEGLRNVG